MSPEDLRLGYDPQSLDATNYHYFIPRRKIRDFLVEQGRFFCGSVVDLGCGFMPYREILTPPGSPSEYLPVDLTTSEIYEGVEARTWDGETLPFESESVDCVITTELFEHAPHPERIARELDRVLKPGGAWVGTVPFVWPIHEAPHDYRRLTPFGLGAIIDSANFRQELIVPLGGGDAALAQMIGIWTHRNETKDRLNPFWIEKVVVPIMKRLLRRDRQPDLEENGAMFTGLGWVAVKESRDSLVRE